MVFTAPAAMGARTEDLLQYHTMVTRKEFPPEELEPLRRALSALGEPHRFLLAGLLSRRSHSVGELVEITGIPQPLVSHHLGILCRAGLAGAERDGRRKLYRLTEPEDEAAAKLARLCRGFLERAREDREPGFAEGCPIPTRDGASGRSGCEATESDAQRGRSDRDGIGGGNELEDYLL
jgi:DNA-binding transcriptional ArsR family regulator